MARPVPQAHDDDDEGSKPFVQRVVSAANTTKPETTAPPSVFGIAGQAVKPKRRSPSPLPTFDATAITIRKGVPLPPSAKGAVGASPYHALIERMEVGDSVELEPRRAKALMAAAKKNKTVRLAMRMLGVDQAAVWRTQ